MAGLSLNIHTLRIRVSFYEIIKLHEGLSRISGHVGPNPYPPFISLFIFGAIVKSAKRFFQKLFHAPQAPLNGLSHCNLAYTFGPGNRRFAQAENEMDVNPPALHFGEGVEGGAEFLRRNLALVNLTGRQRHKKRVMLYSVLTVKGIICFVPVCTEPISSFAPLGLDQRRRYFVGNGAFPSGKEKRPDGIEPNGRRSDSFRLHGEQNYSVEGCSFF